MKHLRSKPSSALPNQQLPRVRREDEEDEAPPLSAKSRPHADMHFVVTTTDDEHRSNHHHPNESGVTDFLVDPEQADAAADLASELGAAFLDAATLGEEHTEHATGEPERALDRGAFPFDEESEAMYEELVDERVLEAFPSAELGETQERAQLDALEEGAEGGGLRPLEREEERVLVRAQRARGAGPRAAKARTLRAKVDKAGSSAARSTQRART